jgi:RNA polymerase sigma factor (sigma-70 family)
MQNDAELLAEYLAGDDEAFAALVHRHAGMVFGVCTRILRSRHDAEDAFQATFLVLARKAADVRPAEQVARWLYGVARRVTLKARHRRERRRCVEALAGESAQATGSEAEVPENLWRVLDEEAARLPGHLLSPFVLCDLEGMTYRDAARQLGVPEGTLSNRLAAARRQLSIWLTRRGIVLPAAGLAAALSPSTVGAAPTDLVLSAAEAASSADALSPLAEGVIRNMAITKIARAVAALVAVLGLAYGGWAVLSARAGDKEANLLDGEWAVVRAEKGGKQLPDDEVKKMKVTIKDGTMTIDIGTRQEAVAVAIDATTKPRGINFRRLKGNNGQVDRGIFELDGDELKICWGEEKAPDGRTEEFKTTKERGGRLFVLKRTKAKGE